MGRMSAADKAALDREDLSGLDDDSALKPPPPHALDLADFLTVTFPSREHIMAPVFPRQGLGKVHAWRGLGKTWFTLWFAYVCAAGGRFLRWHVARPCSVLYVDGEMAGVDMQERLGEIVKSNSDQPAPGAFRIITPDLEPNGIPDFGSPEGQAWLDQAVGETELIVLDNLSSLLPQMSDSEDEPWFPLRNWALRQRRLGKSVLMVDHDGKNETARGRSRKEDQLDTVFHLKRPADYRERDGARFVVQFEKHRGFYGKDAEPFEVALTTNDVGLSEWTMTDIEDAVTLQVVELLKAGATVTQITKELKIGRASVDRQKKKAIARGLYDGK